MAKGVNVIRKVLAQPSAFTKNNMATKQNAIGSSQPNTPACGPCAAARKQLYAAVKSGDVKETVAVTVKAIRHMTKL